MIFFFLLLDLFLHLLLLLLLDVDKIFLNFHDNLLPEFLLLQDCLLFNWRRIFIVVGVLYFVHGKLKVKIRKLHLRVSWLGILENQDEKTACSKDKAIKMENFLLFVDDGLAIDEGIVRCIFFKDFNKTLLGL